MRNRSSRNSALNQSSSTDVQSGCTTATGGAGCLSKAALQGLRSECAAVWFDRVVYERAESAYHVRLLERQNGTVAPSSRNQETCHHGDQEACHHVVQAVWVNKSNLNKTESQFLERQSVAPTSLPLQPGSSQILCDEGYQSQTPTPPTPASKPINGLPCMSSPQLGVWLQKLLYDKAEATYYQNLYGRNVQPENPESSNKRSNSKRRNGAAAKKTKPVVPDQRNRDDVTTTTKGKGRKQDHGCYAEAEPRFNEGAAARTVKTSRNHSSQSQKYDSILENKGTHFL